MRSLKEGVFGAATVQATFIMDESKTKNKLKDSQPSSSPSFNHQKDDICVGSTWQDQVVWRKMGRMLEKVKIL